MREGTKEAWNREEHEESGVQREHMDGSCEQSMRCKMAQQEQAKQQQHKDE